MTGSATNEPKRALVTGGAGGLGAAFVDQLSSDGYDVVSVDRNQPRKREGVIDILSDFSDRAESEKVWSFITGAGPYDLAIFNAGISATGAFEDLPMDAMTTLLEVNLRAPMALTARLLAEGEIAQNGRLLYISSLSHFAGYPGAAAYAASKDGLAIYAKSMRNALRREKIHVSVAFPGPIRTPHAERYAPENADASKRMPPEDAARQIIAAALSGKQTIIPGGGNKIAGILGRLAPNLMTRLMRKIIYDKLDGPKL